MRHFTATQLEEMRTIANNWRKNKISTQEYHNQLSKYYN